MEITIKLNEKLIKQMFELKLNNGKKMDEKTFKKLLFQMKLKHFNTLDEVSKDMEFQTMVQLVKSFDFLKYTIEKSEKINKHNKRLKLKEGEFKSGYWSNTESNCCPKCNKMGSDLTQIGFEQSEKYLNEKYGKDIREEYKDILEYYGKCDNCGIGFIEIWFKNSYIHEIQ
jgi:hypothetical protein